MKYTIIVDKQSRINPSDEKKQYEIDIEELRTDGTTYDSLVVTREETYVMRRLKLSEYHVLTVLEEPVKEVLTELNIELFEGDNYIYLIDMVGNKFYAEYLIKNDFTDMYATKNEMNAAINNTAQSIELTVNQKLEGYSTTEQMNAIIQLLSQNILLEVAKKVGDNEIISKINMSPEEVLINANKINISALDILNLLAGNTINLTSKNITFDSDHLKIDKDGKIEIIDDSTLKHLVYFIVKDKDGRAKIEINSNQLLMGDVGMDSSMIFLGDTLEEYMHLYRSYINIGNQQNNTFIQADGIETPTLTQTSLKSKKKNIKRLNVNALDLIKSSDICLYNLKGEKAKSKKHIGLVIGEGYNCPDEVISEDRQGVEQYSMTSLAWKAIQELIQENNNLKQRIEKLEVQNGNSRI